MTAYALFSRRRLAALALLALAGCSGMLPTPSGIELSQTQLQTRLQSQFPLKSRQLELFDTVLDQPRLRLLPAENRLSTALDYSITTLLPGVPVMRGQLQLSYGLRFEASDRSLRMAAVRLDSLDVSGLPASQAAQVQRLGGRLVDRLLQDLVIHRFSEAELEKARARGVAPGAITVLPGAVRLALDPLPR